MKVPVFFAAALALGSPLMGAAPATPVPCARPFEMAHQIGNVDLDYLTPEQQARGLFGKITVKVTVDDLGRVVSVAPNDTDDDPGVVRVAERAVEQAHFVPECKAGQRVGGTFLFSAEFERPNPRAYFAEGSPPTVYAYATAPVTIHADEASMLLHLNNTDPAAETAEAHSAAARAFVDKALAAAGLRLDPPGWKNRTAAFPALHKVIASSEATARIAVEQAAAVRAAVAGAPVDRTPFDPVVEYRISDAALDRQTAAARAAALASTQQLALAETRRHGFAGVTLVSARRLPFRDVSGTRWALPKMYLNSQQTLTLDLTATYTATR